MDWKWILAAGLLFWAGGAVAGEPLRVGLSGGVARYSASDPDGPTAPASAPDLAAIALLGWGRDTRLRFEAGRTSVTLAAGTRDIGQQIVRTGASLSYQERWRLSYRWKPWLGIGLGYVRENDTLRHTVDSGGFLATVYPDRAQSALDAVLTADSAWRWIHGWRIGIDLRYDAPLDRAATTVVAAGLLLSHGLN